MARPTPRSRILTAYLCTYNVLMFFLHLFVAVDLVNEHRKGAVFNYRNHFSTFRIATAFQLLDLVHGVAGFTKTDPKTGAAQVFGRLFMLHMARGVTGSYPMAAIPIQVMLLAYAAIELIRYPFYTCASAGIDFKPITWLRYNAWIVLYPIGFFTEALTLVYSFCHHKEKGSFAAILPASVASKSWILFNAAAIFIGVLFPFLTFTLLRHMDKQRQSKFGGRLLFNFNTRNWTRKIKQFFTLPKFLKRD